MCSGLYCAVDWSVHCSARAVCNAVQCECNVMQCSAGAVCNAVQCAAECSVQ